MSDLLEVARFEVDTNRERLTIDFVGQDKRSIFEPSRVVIQRGDGEVVESRDDPERSFDGHVIATPWDDIHVAYFSGEALRLSGSRRDHHPHQAADLRLEGRLPARPGAATDRHRHG
jgi:hypothetical protein